jgi:hypothetical protein
LSFIHESVHMYIYRGGSICWKAVPEQECLHVDQQPLCDILTQGLIGLIEYLYHQCISFFLEAYLQRTLGLNVLGPEQFQDW